MHDQHLTDSLQLFFLLTVVCEREGIKSSFERFSLRRGGVDGGMEMFALAPGRPVSTGPVYEPFPAGSLGGPRRAGLTL